MFEANSACISVERTNPKTLRVFMRYSSLYRNALGKEFVDIDLTVEDLAILLAEFAKPEDKPEPQ